MLLWLWCWWLFAWAEKSDEHVKKDVELAAADADATVRAESVQSFDSSTGMIL